MLKPTINFDEFELPFISNIEIEEYDDLNSSEIKENMESLIPQDAIYIGNIDSEVDNWTSWSNKDEYYIIPIIDDKFNWALFRITWDDNWERWEWSFDARMIGFENNYKEATIYILKALWLQWDIDLTDDNNEPYLNFLNNIK